MSLPERRQRFSYRLPLMSGAVLLGVALLYATVTGHWTLRTEDQRGYQKFENGDYDAAARQFLDPLWQGVAYYRAGEFKKAAGVFSGFDTGDATLNHGNSLLFQGKYEEAAERYARALELRPGWAAAEINRKIALARAKALKKEGGDMTGGQLGADDVVFTKGSKSESSGEEPTEGGKPLSESDLRTIWLRKVQTKPADFLRAKFAFQAAKEEGGDE